MSSASSRRTAPRVGVYAMTKASLNNMVEWLAMELMDDNIRVNGIAPGIIPSKLSGPLQPIALNSRFSHPKILGKPEDIGGLAAAICSADGAFLNGETIHPSGGFANKM